MEPKTLHAGDSVSWERAVPAYRASAGWSLRYVFNGPERHQVEALPGDPYRIELTAGATATWAPGSYRWVALLVNGDQRVTLADGRLEVAPNFETVEFGDIRSHAERMLALLEAALEKRIPKDQQSYEIDGQRLDRIPVERLNELRKHYMREVRQQRGGRKLFRPIKARL
ncbi:hypothetical protein DZ956_022370 [Pseudomonas aeruginosa]|uniref:hypothetical protein n=1 Tax=Pseudomonas aeruginosa TaxID=287 RepID=UPI000E317E56|nr:hypothetical protein [Pseudomonas aeruginosa]NPZ19523.1 hypothetical protein [Pseudomonas aeruginosa]